MILEFGDMWTVWNRSDLFLITTNACVRPDGRLVMGAGIAKQARDRWYGRLDLRLGALLTERAKHKTEFLRRSTIYTMLEPEYNLLVSPQWPSASLGLFQVKRHFHMDASIGIIQRSTDALAAWCAEHPKAEVHLNFPGIGNGRLSRDAVMPIIKKLPDSVHVWQFEEEADATI